MHWKNTFGRLGGTGFEEGGPARAGLDALIAYLTAMPAPTLDGAARAPGAELAERGKDLFFAAEHGCAGCHLGGTGSDAIAHDLSGRPRPAHLDASVAQRADSEAFDTPSLRFVSGTAPYFHDGRYATLLDVLTNPDSRMGHTLDLSRRDAGALAAYLETL